MTCPFIGNLQTVPVVIFVCVCVCVLQ